MRIKQDYLNLAIPARSRLMILKNAAHKLNSGHNARKASGNPEPYTWRDVRYSGFHNAAVNRCELSQGFNTCQYTGKKTPIWYCHTGPAFPREMFADEFSEYGRALIEHTGWFADVGCSNIIRGIVVRLPHGRYLAGYYQSDNDERVYYPEIYDCIRDAVYAADRHAESIAEIEREYSERWNAAQELEYECEEKVNRLRECLALRNNPCFTRLRDEANNLIERIREIREILKTEYADCM